MRIISQNGMIDFSYENTMLEIWTLKDDRAAICATFDLCGSSANIAEYSTVEKAKRAMNLLRACYEKSYISPSIHYAAHVFQLPADDAKEIN